MKLEEALKIVDPDTCRDALAVYAGDYDMLHEKAVEAGHMVVDSCKKAHDDIMMVAEEYVCMCKICSGGRGAGICVYPKGDVGCDDCKLCHCFGCTKADTHFKWRGET